MYFFFYNNKKDNLTWTKIGFCDYFENLKKAFNFLSIKFGKVASYFFRALYLMDQCKKCHLNLINLWLKSINKKEVGV